MSAAISGPRSRNSEDLKQILHSPSYRIENGLPCSELLHCFIASKQRGKATYENLQTPL